MDALPAPRIFITHSWKDIEFARRLHNDLKAHGLDVWFDDRTLRPGHRVAEEINRGLEWCDFYIPVVSKASLASPWCWEEINAAITLSNQPHRKQRPIIIPAIAEDCPIPALLSSRLYVSFYNRYDDALRELLEKAFGLQAKVVAPKLEAPPISPPVPPPGPPQSILPPPAEVKALPPVAPPRLSKRASGIIVVLAIVIIILLLMLSTGAGALIARVGGVNAAATWIAALQNPEPKFPTTLPAANPILSSSASSRSAEPTAVPIVVPTSEPTWTPRPTATDVLLPTSPPFIPAPTATDRPTSTPAPTATPTTPPGFYAMSIRVAVPAGLRNGQPQTFFITFFNNTTRTMMYKWFLKIFEPNARNSLGDTPKIVTEFPPGFNREAGQSTTWTKIGPGPCVNYTARVYIWFDDNPNNPQEFKKPDGTSPSVVFPVNCN
jgi:hypothetical protein